MLHDKHTYYFEKYLRNEMSREEKKAFEKKLYADIDFKNDFDKYAANHDAILKQELEEYYNEEIIPNKPKNYTWIWVMISIFGIVLIIDYYANIKYIEKQKENQTYKEVLVDRFTNAFIDPIKKISAKITQNKVLIDTTISTIRADESYYEIDSINNEKIDSSLIENKIQNQFQQYLNGKNIDENVKDVFLNDSLIWVYELEKFKDKYNSINHSTDSTLTDSMVTKLTLQSLSKLNQINKPLFVEFWFSIVGFNGYQFNGKKLILYGINKPFDVFILKRNNSYILHSTWGETAIQADNQLHKFED
ncbi:MAG: hypothetical protein WCI53_07590 [Bacteroidota bacterium]